MAVTATVSKWGNSKGIRIPNEILRKASIEMNDTLSLEVENSGIIILTKLPAPQKGTLEYLFKDYDEQPFQTELVDLDPSIGEEKW